MHLIDPTSTDLDTAAGLQAFRGSTGSSPDGASSQRTSAAQGRTSLDSTAGTSPRFQQTQWTLVRRASVDSAQSREALEELCRAYWYPIYAFIRRTGRSPHDAQDLTQEFFLRLLETNSIGRADPRLGKFRTFLLGALKNFLADAYRKANAWKRGGGTKIVSFEEIQAEERYQLEAIEDRTPEQMYERGWPVVLLETAMARLRDEFQAAGKARQFQVLKPFLSQEGSEGAYERAGAELNASGKTVAVAVHRIRRRFRHVVRSAIADTVSTPGEIEEEYQRLFA
jgi:RNA polymerase sigma factor (sigma-70 family)